MTKKKATKEDPRDIALAKMQAIEAENKELREGLKHANEGWRKDRSLLFDVQAECKLLQDLLEEVKRASGSEMGESTIAVIRNNRTEAEKVVELERGIKEIHEQLKNLKPTHLITKDSKGVVHVIGPDRKYDHGFVQVSEIKQELGLYEAAMLIKSTVIQEKATKAIGEFKNNPTMLDKMHDRVIELLKAQAVDK